MLEIGARYTRASEALLYLYEVLPDGSRMVVSKKGIRAVKDHQFNLREVSRRLRL